MLELNRNQPVNKAAYDPVNFANLPGSAPLSIDPVMFENAINDEQKIAGYVEKTQSGTTESDSVRPQLRVPTLQERINEIEVKRFIAELERQMKAADQTWDTVETQIEILKERIRALFEARKHNREVQAYREIHEAAEKKRWETFELADGKLSLAQSKVDEALEALNGLQASEDPTQEELDSAAAVLKEAHEQVNAAMAGLDAGVIALLATATPEQSARTKKTEVKLTVLEECMYRLKTIMFDDKMATLKHRSELFNEMKTVLIEDIRVMANKQRELDDSKDFWMQFWKWTGVAVAGVVAFLTGGLGGALMGAMTAALVVADLATEGKATEEMMKPLTEAMGPAFEKMITGLMEHLVEEEEYSEDEAVAITMAIFFGATILLTLAPGAAGAGVNKLGQTATGKAIGEAVKETMAEVAENAVVKGIGAAFQAVGEGFDTLLERVGVKAIERGFQDLLKMVGIETTEQYINFLMQAQTATSFIGTLLEGSFSIKSALIQKEGQEVGAAISLAKTDDEIISNEMKKLTDSFGIDHPNKLIQLLSELTASKEDTVNYVHQTMRRA